LQPGVSRFRSLAVLPAQLTLLEHGRLLEPKPLDDWQRIFEPMQKRVIALGLLGGHLPAQ